MKNLIKILTVIALLTLVYLARSFAQGPIEEQVPSSIAYGRLPEAAKKKAEQAIKAYVGASLEMKENVDFILTPALLAQEVLDDKVFPTYPTE